MKKYVYSDFTKNFFKVIDSGEKAYILGFLSGDGCISKNRNLIKIELHQKDSSLLYKIKKSMKLSNPIKFQSRSRDSKHGFNDNFVEKSALFYFSSASIKKDLISLGCGPAKTFNLKPPPNLTTKMIPHYIRGLFDADGSIHKVTRYDKRRKKHYNSFCFSMRSTEEILNYVSKQLNLNNKLDTYSSVPKLATESESKIHEIFLYLYKDASIFLERKYHIFNNYFNN